MSQKTISLFSRQTLPKSSFPKFLLSKDEPEDRLGLEMADEASKELAAETLHSWYAQKRGFRRQARQLRQHNDVEHR